IVAAAAIVGEQLLLTRELHAHATNPDDVGLRFQRDRLDVLVYDLDSPVRRAQRRQRGKAQRRVHGPLVRQNLSKRPLGAPEAFRKSRVDQQQAHVKPSFWSKTRSATRDWNAAEVLLDFVVAWWARGAAPPDVPQPPAFHACMMLPIGPRKQPVGRH